ncbi:MAG: hypothetical protein KF696_08185 [Planctomycetes bacterium]|nr:hypothetical protein [Planctomycetota bacterium]MCW8135671.1 hypothetical protein [Planctomycetota bacterium]
MTNTLTLGQARDAYLQRYGFSTAAYEERWAAIKLGPIKFWIPSTRTRREAIRFHDLHHTLTGYPAIPSGEAEIGAWEVATGCGRFRAAWVLNLFAMGMGLLIAPGKTFRAWVRGRKTKSNFYHLTYDEALLHRSADEMRREIGLPEAPPAATVADKASFVLWAGVALLQYALAAAILLAPVAALVYWLAWVRQ